MYKRQVQEVRLRYRVTWVMNVEKIQQDEATDGVFPLLTNQHEMPALEVLQAYKRQPLVMARARRS